jgi:hypothetical protein
MKIQSIFIVSHLKEFHSKRLHTFLNNLIQTELDNIKIYLFMSNNINSSQIEEIKNIVTSLNLEFVLYDNSKHLSYIMFENIFKFKLIEYQTILILESDCVVDKMFLSKINDDLASYNNIWIYGSYYYGISPWFKPFCVNRFHMNGVAVYNRTNDFISFLNSIKEYHNCNYDMVITNELRKKNMFLKKTFDSKYILNLSPSCDNNVSLNYKDYKENTCILHTKNEKLLSKLLN